MKFVERHPFAGPDAAARKIVEIANGVEAAQDGLIFIERINEPFLAGSGDRVRLITRGGYNWSDRYPWIVEAALKKPADAVRHRGV
jgi:hypothetical protein